MRLFIFVLLIVLPYLACDSSSSPPGRERLFLYGDSIRIQYEATVRRNLTHRFEIWSPGIHNGTSSGAMLITLNNLDGELFNPIQSFDVIVLNAGIWDALGIDGGAMTVDEYAANWNDALDLIEIIAPDAQVVVISSTLFDPEEDLGNINALIRDLNDVLAVEAEKRPNVRLLDLAAYVEESEPRYTDGVHFTPEYAAELGDVVSAALLDF